MGQIYGPIISLPITGNKPLIMLGDVNLVKQLLPQKEFLNRKAANVYQGPWKSLFSVSTNTDHQTYPFFFLSGESWAKRRKYATSVCLYTL